MNFSFTFYNWCTNNGSDFCFRINVLTRLETPNNYSGFMEKKYSLKEFSRPKLELPIKDSKLLLHSCCAPCAGEIMEAVAASDIDTTVYFYNPNIHPIEELSLIHI